MAVITVKSRSKNLRTAEVDLGAQTSVASLKQEVSKKNKNISVHRLRLTYQDGAKQQVLTDEMLKRNYYDLELYVKDLGPQISWRLVFIIEYLGPILIHSILYQLSLNAEFIEKWAKIENVDPSLNRLIYALNTLHYSKRLFESIFIHKFSQATMPLFNLFKNSSHYWLLNGTIGLGYFGYGFIFGNGDKLHGIYRAFRISEASTLISLFIVSELWNFYIHYRLRVFGDKQNLLESNGQRVPINEGLFKIFVAPNYTFEVLSWFWFTLLFKLNFFALLFLFVSATQMYLWAMKKNKKYNTKRAFLIPFVF